ncbi:arsenic resistance protein [Crassaminicella thermophila]|uniref:Arsenic resistance protein n=1 Tax=Crassaminicella thermophila TaxID=2599308 RepID=A0A5C0SHL0_CRATE|nr:bile acid:sodium symporter [Crassaminicella thermophila]QEK13472.1 arsenic resistance protein [Crassaminicella thermophila]
MWNLLKILKKHLAKSILASMVLGLIFGYFFDSKFLSMFIIPLTFLMVFPMMVNLNYKELLNKGNGALIVSSQGINFILIPFIAFCIGSIFFKNQPMIFVGFMLMSVLPTSGMTISWTGFAKGNIHAAIKITIVALLLSALIAPLVLKMYLGTTVAIPIFKIIRQILIVVLIPMIAGATLRYIMINNIGLEQYNSKWKMRFPLLSSLGVIGIIFVATSLKAKTIINNPSIIILLIIPIILFYLINFTITTMIGRFFFSWEDSIALVYGTVMRNLSVALAIAMTAFSSEGSNIALIIAVAYIFQVQMAAWYIKLVQKKSV